MNVPVPEILEETVEVVKSFSQDVPQKGICERTCEQIRDAPISQVIEQIMDVPAPQVTEGDR